MMKSLPGIGKKQSGFTLLELMIAGGLMVFVFSAVMTALVHFSGALSLAQEQTALRKIRANILQELNRPDAWVNTYQGNPSFTCLLQTLPTNACRTAGNAFRPFVLHNRKDDIILNAIPTTAGFTFQATTCNDYQTNGTSADQLRCPIRLVLTWRLINWGGGYFPTGYLPFGYLPQHYFPPFTAPVSAGYFYFGRVSAQVEVRGRFVINNRYKAKANAQRYDFTIYKDVP